MEWGWTASTVITLLAVLVALTLGISSFLQNNNLFKKQRRNTLLNEISQWATNIHNNFAPELFDGLRDIGDRYKRRMYEDKLDPATCTKLYDEEKQELLTAALTTYEIKINELIIRSKYMCNISKVLDKDLHKQIYKLAIHLKARKILIRKKYLSLGKDEKESQKWTVRGAKHIKYLQKYCDDVLSTIGMLLTKDAT